MQIHELRDQEQARIFCEQSLWLARAVAPSAGMVAPVIGLALEMADAGEPWPPFGVLADIGRLALEPDVGRDREIAPMGWLSDELTRTYEDHVLGKLYTDSSFERGSDAVRRFEGRDRTRGLAFLIRQLMSRAEVGGILFSPAILKMLRTRPEDEILSAGLESLQQIGPMPILVEFYEELTRNVRNLASVLGLEDVFELEHGTALAQYSQRVALRQVLQAAAWLEERMPRLRPLSSVRRHEVPTQLLDEDIYPVGGFTSISNRGTVESLLHSQLAYMERDDRPDLFDIKFLRDELLYYARDENQFLRRRRTFVFAFFRDLEQARCKDADVPWQRIVLAVGLTLAAHNKILEWLGGDALNFEFLFLDETNQPKALEAEEAVLQMVLREQIANGSVRILRMARARFPSHCAQHARRSLCHCLSISTRAAVMKIEGCVASELKLAAARPELKLADDATQITSDDDKAISAWVATLQRLLRAWQ
jgi:hypothetical protein